jgi:hypothetical protein
MTCFSPFDRKALYQALARNVAIRSQDCTDPQMRQSLASIAEHWACLGLLCESVQALKPDSVTRGRSRQREELHARYRKRPEKIPSPGSDA